MNVSVESPDKGVVVVTMARAEKRNALSLEMMGELTAAFRSAAAQKSTRTFVLRGEGPAFSAGHDLRELQCADAAAAREIFDACVELMETIQSIPQPVIAEVATIATAAGCQLVATCDLAIAAHEATFATPGVSIGLFCTTPMVALTRAIGRKRAMEMLLTGDPIDAATAAEWGLINRVVPAADLHQAALSLALRIATSASTTIERGPSRTSLVTTTSRLTGRQCMKDASSPRASFASDTVQSWCFARSAASFSHAP